MVLPSVKEGWGIAVIEAAAVGTPTVAYRSAGGITESVQDGLTGLLVDDFHDLVRQASSLLECQETRERLGQQALERVAAYGWSAAAEDTAAVLTASLTGRRR